MANFDRQLSRVLSGEITFNDFARATRREFERMAVYLTRRWVPPSWYVLDDVVQELWLGAWAAVWEWSPVMGPPLSRYVIFNAMSHAKRALHKARGAKLSGSSDKNPSHIERPLSSFGCDGEGEALAEALLAEAPAAEDMLIEEEEREEAFSEALTACRTETERAVISAIKDADDMESAWSRMKIRRVKKKSYDWSIPGAEVIYNDIDWRISLRLTSERHAERVVVETASAVEKRLTA